MSDKDYPQEFPDELVEQIKKLKEDVRASMHKNPKRIHAFLAIRRKILKKEITPMEYLLELGFSEQEAKELIAKAG